MGTTGCPAHQAQGASQVWEGRLGQVRGKKLGYFLSMYPTGDTDEADPAAAAAAAAGDMLGPTQALGVLDASRVGCGGCCRHQQAWQFSVAGVVARHRWGVICKLFQLDADA